MVSLTEVIRPTFSSLPLSHYPTLIQVCVLHVCASVHIHVSISCGAANLTYHRVTSSPTPSLLTSVHSPHHCLVGNGWLAGCVCRAACQYPSSSPSPPSLSLSLSPLPYIAFVGHNTVNAFPVVIQGKLRNIVSGGLLQVFGDLLQVFGDLMQGFW